MSEKLIPLWEIGVGIVTIAVCILLYWDSLNLPDPVFDPLGSVMVPRATCVILGLFASAIIFKGMRAINQKADNGPTKESPLNYSLRPGLAVGILGLTATYVLVLSTRLVRFSELTFVFVILSGMWMGRFKIKAMPVLLILALIMGYGGQYVFKEVFFVDLP